ncbi:MFS transporter [Bacillus fungorum]|uniref:MFS transporter n=1 Tax=Bacillus fungorum TaxID=2039284 RepID=A0A2G6QA60_9BACI|nr:MFS transporter [Bacillus fungorum]PIE93641.1 MFS transporter [Bacillus fungorum]
MSVSNTTIFNKNLLIILASQLLFQLGLWIGIIGNLEFLQKNVSSHLLQSMFLVMGSVSSVFIAPYAGRLIDEISQKYILVTVGCMRIISVSAMFIALFTDSVWWMLLYSIGVGCSAAFFEPTVQAILPKISSPDGLIKVNALNLNMVTLARIFGASIGGILLLFLSLWTIYLIVLAIFLIVLILIIFLDFEKSNEVQFGVKQKKRQKVSFGEIFPIIKQNLLLKMIISFSIIPLIFISGFNLFVIQISEIQGNSFIKGILYSVEGISIIVSSSLLFILKNKMKPLSILYSSIIIITLVQFLLLKSEIMFIPILAFILFGFAYGLFNPMLNTISQKNISSNLHGRFFAFKLMIERIVLQISMLLIGFLLDVVGFYGVNIILGTLSLIIVIYFMFQNTNTSNKYLKEQNKEIDS